MPTSTYSRNKLRSSNGFQLRWKRLSFYFLLLTLAFGSTSCSVSQYLSKKDPLYDGAAIRFTNSEALPDRKGLTFELQSQVQQNKVGKTSLWWWYRLETTKEKGVKKWLQRTLGKPPTFYSPAKANLTLLLMKDYLKDHGYFGAEIYHDTSYVDAFHILDSFVIEAVPRARVDTLVWPQIDSSRFAQFLETIKAKSFIKKDDFYSISVLDAERARIKQLGARSGFFEFTKNNVFYIVDSTASKGKVSVHMRLSEGSDSLAFTRFGIGDTYVYPNYSRLADYSGPETDSIALKDLRIIRHSTISLHPEVLDRRIGLRSGDYYNQIIYENTLNQLLDLGVFKYVNYEVKPRQTDSTAVLDQYIYLTQGKSKEIRYSLEATTRTGAAMGLGASVSYSDKNVFNGAEDFTLSVSAAVGPQSSIADATQTVAATEAELSAELALPRFVGPFSEYVERTAFYIPRTVVNARYQLLDRTDFGLQTISLKLGYRYRANRYATHELYPLSIYYNRLINTSAEFDLALAESERLELAFTNNAVMGLEYIFRYSDQQLANTSSFWSIEGGIKTSGNVATLLASEPDVAGEAKRFAGVQISQFFRAHVDASRTIRFRNTSLASRVYLGAAIPYGNSDVIPYADQFFSGGPNSVRAFPLRGLGPGAIEPLEVSGSTSLNQSGDIRLELNTEYRFPVWGYLEGAAFVDAGNVWLFEDIDGDSPEGVFNFNTFAEQIAVGTGLGLRLNLDFLIIRFDGAVPVYKPYLTGSNRLKFNLNDDFQLQIAIGYPF